MKCKAGSRVNSILLNTSKPKPRPLSGKTQLLVALAFYESSWVNIGREYSDKKPMEAVTDQPYILVVDDDPNITKMVSLTLGHIGYHVITVSSGEEALKHCNKKTPHLVLLDMNMPGIGGLKTLENIKANSEFISVIFLSGESETDTVIKGLNMGADDYIKKPFHPSELVARVRAQIRIKDLTDRLSVANKKLQALAETDDLTGLFNMRNLYQKLNSEIKRAKRFDRYVGVVMMDMDHFKTVNDSNDHLFGSFVLKEVGGLIKKCIREVDIPARYGGDEFIMVLCETHQTGAEIFGERLRRSIKMHTFDNGYFQMKLTCSIGIALVSPKNIGEFEAETLVKYADQALYMSKNKGRDQVHVLDVNETLQLEKEKKSA